MGVSYWLMKAEPNSRIEKGKDVKFSVDDFEAVGTTPWEGVRNHEAKKLMQSMNIGDKVLFYHSNCKTPGVAAFAEVVKEAYPDHSAWDPEHPYYDAKGNKDNPKWYMVDVAFVSRVDHFIPLTLFKRIAALPLDEPTEDIDYIRKDGVKAIKSMALVNRGRLSVQPVKEEAWNTVQLLSKNGGWDETSKIASGVQNTKTGKGAKSNVKANSKETSSRNKRIATTEKETGAVKNDDKSNARKRKLPSEDTDNPPRRSLRIRR